MSRRWSDELAGGSALVLVAALLVSVAAVAATATQGAVQVSVALAFLALIAVGDLASINLPGGRRAAPLGAAGALAYALLGSFGVGEDAPPTEHGVMQVVAVTAAGILLGTIPHIAFGSLPRLETLARRILVTAFAALLFRPLYTEGAFDDFPVRGWQLPALMLAIVLLSALLDGALAAVARSGREHIPFLAAARDEFRALLGIGSAIGATGVLIALAAQAMGFWALPVFALPLLVAQFSFRRYAAIRATYRQTIEALSRVSEVGGYTESGHSQRVSRLALAVGAEMGMSEAQLDDLRYAALMHDIGQLSLPDRIPSGATSMVAPDEQRRIASLGAEVIRQTGVLDRVALIVECQAEPYRRPGQPLDAGIPLASRIIRAVNAYDDHVGGSLDSERRLFALERLRGSMAFDYDPRVVETLSRVVERTMLLNV
jgi:hypothetical protein